MMGIPWLMMRSNLVYITVILLLMMAARLGKDLFTVYNQNVFQ